MGKLTYNLSDFQKAAITFRRDLLRLPLIGLDEILPYVTVRTGVRYEELVGTSTVDAQLHPYVKNKITDSNLALTLRPLKTYFGAVNAEFEPNAEIQTLLGHRASQALGGKQASTPQAQEVLANIAKSVGSHLNANIWGAKRVDAGTTTAALFDGFDTITATEVAAGNISEAKKNLVELDAAITSSNAVTTLKELLYNMPVQLRKEDCFLFCPYEVADAYNENYMLTHSGQLYNKTYNQVYVEGSSGRLTIVPLSSKAGSKFIHITPKRNMLIGCDQMSDEERVEVANYAPDTLTFMMRMFFGCQFESIDPTRMMVAKLYEAPAGGAQEPGEDEVEH